MTDKFLAGQDELEVLDMQYCTRLTTAALAGCKALRCVDVSNCKQAESAEFFKDCASLRQITAQNVGLHPNALTGCKALEKLDISGCFKFCCLVNVPLLDELVVSQYVANAMAQSNVRPELIARKVVVL